MKKKLFCALWTPTDGQGKLLKKEIVSHLHFLASHKVDGVLVGGSTGEFLYLSPSLRKELLETVLEHKGHLEVLFNLSHPDPREVESLAHFTRPLPIAGVLLLPPLYYPISPADLSAYFIHMAKHTPHPFYLYNFPERANVQITLQTIETVYNAIPLAGIKLSGGNLEHLKAVCEWGRGKKFIPYSGNDIKLFEALEYGAQGLIGGLVNVIPDILSKVIETHDLSLKEKLSRLDQILKKLNFPHNVRAFMEARSFATGAPKMPLSKETEAHYSPLVQELRALLHEWHLI